MGHLKDINKTYLQHLVGAWRMAFWFGFGSLRLVIHGIIPNFDTEAGHSTVQKYEGPTNED
jgi:hypothetical protein|tara:strand:- start:165 stop:347 length:183 start_codon:yes stop_codon:yes gene_type:complete